MDKNSNLLAYYCKLINGGGSQGVSWQPPPPLEGVRIFVGASLSMGVITYLAMDMGAPLLVASFGASACLIFYVPAGPFSQPRNVIGGQIIAAASGVAVLNLLGCTWYGAAISVGSAIVAMLYTRTMHPPAAATALLAVLSNQSYLYPLAPVGLGAALLVLSGLAVNRFLPQASALLAGRRQRQP